MSGYGSQVNRVRLVGVGALSALQRFRFGRFSEERKHVPSKY